ncbi:MAG: stage III sporulation protein AC [Clostridia bacterium]|nr:stage III sporulation protein AC [Clostridia bacterium]
MEIEVLFKVAGIGILAAVIVQLLKQNGREEVATVAAIVGLLIATMLMISLLSELIDTIRTTFSLY